MNAQQLKNAILQEAITGRLVPQDPNDEPASVLLDKIRKEKAKLVKEGKLKKKDLEEKPISKEEIPFEIPESWEWCRMSNLIQLLSGQDFPPNKYNDKKVGTPYITGASNISKGKLIINRWTETPSVIGVEGDLLIVCKGSGVGKMCVCDIPKIHIARQIQIIRSIISSFKIDFLRIVVNANLQSIISKAQGVIPGISRDDVLDLYVPLPPLAEQHRIVAKIEELLPKVEEYGKAQEALDKLNAELPERLKKSILQEAITGKLVPQDPNDEPASVLLDRIRKEKARLVKEKKIKKSALKEEPITDEEKLFSIPTTWEWCKLGWIGDWGAGATPAKGISEYYTNGTIPWLRTGELNNGVVSDSEIKVTPYALQKCSLRECQVGDVLIAMYGATIGKVAIAGIKLTTNQACCACTPYQVYNKYLLYYLMASKQRFIDLGEGGAQPNISREKIIAFPFPLPPLAEQHRIVAKIEELLSKIDKLKTK